MWCDGLKLSFGKCSLFVEFVVFDYVDFLWLCYEYCFLGLDSDWIWVDVIGCNLSFGLFWFGYYVL